MYFVQGSNEAIVTQAEFDQAAELRRSRKHTVSETEGRPFAGKLYCGCCGSLLRSKMTNGIWYWVCRTHETSISDCPLSPIRETEIMAAFQRLSYNLRHHPQILHYMVKTELKIRDRQMQWFGWITGLLSGMKQSSASLYIR